MGCGCLNWCWSSGPHSFPSIRIFFSFNLLIPSCKRREFVSALVRWNMRGPVGKRKLHCTSPLSQLVWSCVVWPLPVFSLISHQASFHGLTPRQAVLVSVNCQARSFLPQDLCWGFSGSVQCSFSWSCIHSLHFVWFYPSSGVASAGASSGLSVLLLPPSVRSFSILLTFLRYALLHQRFYIYFVMIWLMLVLQSWGLCLFILTSVSRVLHTAW